jgi:hypothetical protein
MRVLITANEHDNVNLILPRLLLYVLGFGRIFKVKSSSKVNFLLHFLLTQVLYHRDRKEYQTTQSCALNP